MHRNLGQVLDMQDILEKFPANNLDDFLDELSDNFLPRIATVIYISVLNSEHMLKSSKIDSAKITKIFNDEEIYNKKPYNSGYENNFSNSV